MTENQQNQKSSSPRERAVFASRITDWQRRNRGYVRKQLKKTQDERVARNKARRILIESGRAMNCYKAGCNATTNLRADHIDKNPLHNTLSNLRWVCVKHDSNTKEKGTDDKTHKKA